MLSNFTCLFGCLLISRFKKVFQGYYQHVKQFRNHLCKQFRLGPDLGLNCLQRCLADKSKKIVDIQTTWFLMRPPLFICVCFFSSFYFILFFYKISKLTIRLGRGLSRIPITIRVPNSLDPDQTQHNTGSKLFAKIISNKKRH